jgi:hypothetical protein
MQFNWIKKGECPECGENIHEFTGVCPTDGCAFDSYD